MPPEPRRRRRRRKPKAKSEPSAERSPRLEPITSARRLDLSLPADQPLSDDEIKEMRQHLDFLRRFKGALRLSPNAAEDLLINGVKTPSERGVCRHLLAKVDHSNVSSALARDPLKGDDALRARFLAGIVRIDPDVSWLLEYLAALSLVAERREAAAAFSLTIDRIDFAAASESQVRKVLEVITTTFSGHDQTQVLFGLLDSESFRRAFDRVVVSESESTAISLADTFAPLVAAHEVVFLDGPPPDDDEDTSALDEGLRRLLSSPFAVLASYPESARARLARLAMAGHFDGKDAQGATRKLMDTLPDDDPAYAELRVARAEQLMRSQQEDKARPLLNRLSAQGVKWATRRAEALGWKKTGRVTTSKSARPDDLVRGFWIDGASFAWIRTGGPEHAGRMSAEAKLQAELHTLGVLPVLAHGMAKDGHSFIAVPQTGHPVDLGRKSLRLADAISLAIDGVHLLNDLARAGIELPDVDESRFRWLGGSPPRVVLASCAGAVSRDAAAVQIAHVGLARAWVKRVLTAAEGSLPPALTELTRRRTPMFVLASELAEQYAKQL